MALHNLPQRNNTHVNVKVNSRQNAFWNSSSLSLVWMLFSVSRLFAHYRWHFSLLMAEATLTPAFVAWLTGVLWMTRAQFGPAVLFDMFIALPSQAIPRHLLPSPRAMDEFKCHTFSKHGSAAIYPAYVNLNMNIYIFFTRIVIGCFSLHPKFQLKIWVKGDMVDQ